MATEMDLDKLQDDIECDRFSLAKWSPMATEINRDEFLGLSFSHHMEILHKTKNIDEVLLCIHEAVTHQWDKVFLSRTALHRTTLCRQCHLPGKR